MAPNCGADMTSARDPQHRAIWTSRIKTTQDDWAVSSGSGDELSSINSVRSGSRL